MSEKKLDLATLESWLWDSANILRGSIDSSDFKNYIFGLLFLKRSNDVFEEEVETIKDNFIQHLFEEISKKEIQVGNFQMQLSSLINKDLVFGTLEEKFTKPVITDSICSCLGEDWEFQAVSTGQFIWTKF